MSLDEVYRFDDKIKNDFNFFKLFDEALRKPATNSYEQLIVDFGKEQGFDFSLEELNKFINYEEEFSGGDNLHDYSASQNNTVRNKQKLSITGLDKLFIWLSGASPIILATCPESEQKRQAALGGAVLIPVFLSTISSSFLLYTLSFDKNTILIVSILWAIIILLMDRALLSTYRKGFSFLEKFCQYSLRLIISLLISITIAHPVVLLLFSERIDAEYHHGENSRIKKDLKLHYEKCDFSNKKSDISITSLDIDKLRSEIDSYSINQCLNDIEQQEQSKEVGELIARKNQKNIDKENARKQIIEDMKKADMEQYGKEKNELYPELSGKKGRGEQYYIYTDDATTQKRKISELDKEIADIDKKVLIEIERYKQGKLQERKQQCQNKQKDNENKIHDREESLKVSKQTYERILKDCESDNIRIKNLKPDLMTSTEILFDDIIYHEGKISWHSLFVFLVFMLLFLVIDMLAVGLKIIRSGLYEDKVDVNEHYNQLTYRLEQRVCLIFKFANLTSKEWQLTNRLEMNTLKTFLTNNLNNIIGLFAKYDENITRQFFKNKPFDIK